MQEREEALFEQIKKEAHLSSKEAEKLMNKHLEDLKEANGLSSCNHIDCNDVCMNQMHRNKCNCNPAICEATNFWGREPR